MSYWRIVKPDTAELAAHSVEQKPSSNGSVPQCVFGRAQEVTKGLKHSRVAWQLADATDDEAVTARL